MEHGASQFIAFLQTNGAEIIEMTSHEEEAYRQEWFNTIVPANKKQKAIDCYCFDKDDWCGYLWHVFSYEILDCIKGNEAKDAFDSIPKQDAILLANWSDIASCRIRNISNITAELIDLLDDVILIDCIFEWTYAKTHELNCGPYFLNIDSTAITHLCQSQD